MAAPFGCSLFESDLNVVAERHNRSKKAFQRNPANFLEAILTDQVCTRLLILDSFPKAPDNLHQYDLLILTILAAFSFIVDQTNIVSHDLTSV
jgi:hypothetical protein